MRAVPTTGADIQRSARRHLALKKRHLLGTFLLKPVLRNLWRCRLWWLLRRAEIEFHANGIDTECRLGAGPGCNLERRASTVHATDTGTPTRGHSRREYFSSEC